MHRSSGASMPALPRSALAPYSSLCKNTALSEDFPVAAKANRRARSTGMHRMLEVLVQDTSTQGQPVPLLLLRELGEESPGPAPSMGAELSGDAQTAVNDSGAACNGCAKYRACSSSQSLPGVQLRKQLQSLKVKPFVGPFTGLCHGRTNWYDRQNASPLSPQ